MGVSKDINGGAGWFGRFWCGTMVPDAGTRSVLCVTERMGSFGQRAGR